MKTLSMVLRGDEWGLKLAFSLSALHSLISLLDIYFQSRCGPWLEGAMLRIVGVVTRVLIAFRPTGAVYRSSMPSFSAVVIVTFVYTHRRQRKWTV